MNWTKRETELSDVLSTLIYRQEGIVKLAQEAGIHPSKINLAGNATEIWHDVIRQALNRGYIEELISVALTEFPEEPFLIAAKQNLDAAASNLPGIDEKEWKGIDHSNLEVLTMKASTLLPISFLQKGIDRSKAVGKVEVQAGQDCYSGSGFLFRTEGLGQTLFMTNQHVVPAKEQLKNVRVIFNFELDAEGNSRQSEAFTPDCSGYWLSSPVADYDFSIFALEDPDSMLLKYGFIELEKISVEKFDFVNIIQHPSGQWKQISLYHNVVTSSSKVRVQYLTDTLKGSSGSPVFDSQWNVVALHHSGGNIKKNEGELPTGFKSRNEGIPITPIMEMITAHQ